MYTLNKLLPQSGRQDVTVSVSGGQESLFQIPAKQVFNFAKSHLCLKYTVPATAAYNRAFMNCMPLIRQLQLYGTNGVMLCDLNFANNYTRVVWDPETDLKEFLTYDVPEVVATTAAALLQNPINTGAGFLLNRNNATAPLTQRPAMIQYGSALNYTEAQYVMVSGNGVNSGLIINIDMPLELYKNTVFALDKDLYFGQTLTMRIVWEGANRIYYLGNSDVNPDAGPPSAPTLPVAINNLSLYLAVQKNPSIISSLVSQVQSGMTMILPWVNSYINNLYGTSQSVQIKLTKSDGKRLCKIYHSIFNNTTTTNVAYDINNLGNAASALSGDSAKVYQYYTLLNNGRLQQFNVDTTQLDDWKLHKEYLIGSVIQMPDIYEYNWFHCDNFTGIPAIESKKLQNNEAGLDLSIDQLWEFFGSNMGSSVTPGGTFNHNTFAILQKVLTITEQGYSIS